MIFQINNIWKKSFTETNHLLFMKIKVSTLQNNSDRINIILIAKYKNIGKLFIFISICLKNKIIKLILTLIEISY